MRVYFWGIGQNCDKALKNFKRENNEIAGFIDNNPKCHGEIYEGKSIIYPREIQDDFDYIIVTVVNYKSVLFQLEQRATPLSKIICYFDKEYCRDKYRDIIDLQSWRIDILEQRIDVLECLLSIRFNNMGYEISDKIGKNFYRFPIVLNAKEAVKKIISEKCSMIRFGDGEFEIMAGNDRPVFQQYNEKLSIRLKAVFHSEDDRILIGIANNYGDLDSYTDEVADGIRTYMTREVRQYHDSLLKEGKTYYDAYLFKSYYPYRNKTDTVDRISLIKSIWQNRDVIMVEGENTRTGYGNDLFDNTKSLRRILCPTINAFDYYDMILNHVMRTDKTCLILIALGPAAKILAYDLVQEGYQVIDIGQIDMDYEWYKRQTKVRVPIANKYVSQLPPAEILPIDNESYEKQVIVNIATEKLDYR